MFKSTVMAALAVAALAPAAFAEGKTVTLTHQYDTGLVSSDDGAAELIAELDRAAKRACTSRVPGLGISFTDEACAESLLTAAVKQIHTASLEAGTFIAPAFEKAALTQLASVD
ncbi:MAG: UrcA family protein [Acidobacteria bacterium]|jgi:UrcA family protein|nr:UrcA family protein [Acidobacteriota bacterium]